YPSATRSPQPAHSSHAPQTRKRCQHALSTASTHTGGRQPWRERARRLIPAARTSTVLPRRSGDAVALPRETREHVGAFCRFRILWAHRGSRARTRARTRGLLALIPGRQQQFEPCPSTHAVPPCSRVESSVARSPSPEASSASTT